MAKANSDFSDIRLKKVSIPDKEWKDYKKSASQDEMYILALGMKIWLAQTRVKYLIFSLCLLATTVLGIALLVIGNSGGASTLATVGAFVLIIGYLIFGFVLYGRNNILSSYLGCKANLSKENAKLIKETFKTSAGAGFVDFFMSVIMYIVSYPLLFVIAIIGAIIPSLFNTALLVPEGYGFEKLEEAKAYYEEKGFFAEMVEDNKFARAFKAGFTETPLPPETYKVYEDGYERTLTSCGGNKYKDDIGNIWITDDGGTTFHRK